MASESLIKAAAVTAELCGRTFTPAAARIFCEDLEAYPEEQVLRALARCRKDVKGILTTSDVIARIDDGRPGVEEAWALIPKAEDATIVWTEEMAAAYAVAAPLLASDKIAARMAFKEAYQREVTAAKDAAKPACWTISLGHDKEQRKRVLAEAAHAGRISLEVAYDLCPALPPPESLLKALPPPDERKKSVAREQLRGLADKFRGDPKDPKAWARNLRTADQGGQRISAAQREAWQEALKHQDGTQAQQAGHFEPIPDELLPPGLRKALQRERSQS
jgi:hypothetical protein